MKKFVENVKKVKESESLELKRCKETVPASLWETYSSFSNTGGGVIILGVEEGDPQNIICGVSNPEKVATDLRNALKNKNKVSYCSVLNESVKVIDIEAGKSIIVFDIKAAPWGNRPVYLNNNPENAYIRVGESDQRMSQEEREIFLRNALPARDAQCLAAEFTIEDLDLGSVLSFKEKVASRYPRNEYGSMSSENFLIEIGALIKSREGPEVLVPRGTLLFLGKNNSIKEIYPSFHLDYINKCGDNPRYSDRVSTDDPQDMEMNIYNFCNVVHEKLGNAMNVGFQLTEKNIRKEEIKFDEALREAFINALAHADYEQGNPTTKIEVYPGWFRFYNPGTMLISVSQFYRGGSSILRNTIIMKMFRLLGLSERQGMGGPEIIKTASKRGTRLPMMDSTLEGTEIKIWTVDLEHAYPELTLDEKVVFQLIAKSRNGVAMRDMENSTGWTKYGIKKAVDGLLEQKLIERNGKGAGTKYGPAAETREMYTQLQIAMDEIGKLF